MIATDYGENSGDSAHAEVHFRTSCHRKILGRSFVFKNNVAGKGLPKHDPSGLGAGGPRFKSGRPDQSFLRLRGSSQKSFPASAVKTTGTYCNIPRFFSYSSIITARYFSSLSTATTLWP